MPRESREDSLFQRGDSLTSEKPLQRSSTKIVQAPIHEVDSQWETPAKVYSFSRSSIDLVYLKNQIRRATTQSDRKHVDKLWYRFLQDMSESKGRGEPEAKICAEFLRAFMSMKYTNRAAEVWNKMNALGLKPVQKHWVALLMGCVKLETFKA